MNEKILAAIISSGVIFLTLLYNMYKNNKQFKQARESSKYKTYYDIIKERRDKAQMKIDEFYFPLKCYLAQSKTSYLLLTENKPEGFRTLEFLLDRKTKFNGQVAKWEANDDVLLKRIFHYGELIENLILNKRVLVKAKEFIDSYKPSEGFDDIQYPEHMSLLDITVSHLGYIRDAYNGNLEGDVRFKKYVYPRELNRSILKRIKELEASINKDEAKMTQFIERISDQTQEHNN